MNHAKNTFNDGDTAYLVLKTTSFTNQVPNPSDGFYVKGTIHDGMFQPESSVLGIGILATSGTPGWLEIDDLKFFPMQTARAPESPYIDGYQTLDGFVPSNKLIK